MKSRINKLSATIQEKLQNRTFVFRLIVTIISIDFIAFITLGSINPLQLINPARFLWSAPTDNRQIVSLYFPKSFDIEKIGKGATNEPEDIAANIIKVSQKMYLPETNETTTASSETAALAAQIIHELILGPQDLQAKKFIKDKHFIKDIWFNQGDLSLSVNYNTWYNLNERTRTLAQLCVEKSLKENLNQVKNIHWDI